MRLPMIAAWSIPGSVLLISGLQRYDISELVGVYLVIGVVSALLSITGVFSKLLAVVPSGVTNGVLAGILLPICFSAVTASQQMPVMAIIMVLAFFITRRLAPLFAVPAAMGSGILWLILSGAIGSAPAPVGGSMVAQPVWITPSFDATALVSIGVPLLLVTMAGQNLPGLEMMRSFGYRFNARTALTACNIGGILLPCLRSVTRQLGHRHRDRVCRSRSPPGPQKALCRGHRRGHVLHHCRDICPGNCHGHDDDLGCRASPYFRAGPAPGLEHRPDHPAAPTRHQDRCGQ